MQSVIKILKIGIVGLILTSSFTVFGDNLENDVFRKTKDRQTKSYIDEKLSAEEYYEAALKGELQGKETKKNDLFLFSELEMVKKDYDKYEKKLYKDTNGDTWLLKRSGRRTEYLGSKIMDLLVGFRAPEVKLMIDEEEYIALKFLENFVTKAEVDKNLQNSYDNMSIEDEAIISIAMDLMGLIDRHDENMGYLRIDNKLVAARVDLDQSFSFMEAGWIERAITDSKVLEYITAIPDDMILYVLGDAYNDLWKAGVSLDYENYKDLGSTLIARKHGLRDLLPEVREFEALYHKVKNNPSDYSEEDNLRLNELIKNLCRIPFLQWVIRNDQFDLVSLLIEKGADIYEKDAFSGATALHWCAAKGDLEGVRLLIDKGLDIDIKENLMKNTPLFWAVAHGQLDIVRFLVSKGADVKIKDNQGHTLMHMACWDGGIEVVRYLFDQLIEINSEGILRMTPLQIAIEMEDEEVVAFLTERGAK